MFYEPGTTRLDLRFRLWVIPVRVHPVFWIVVFLLGWNLPIVEQLLWVCVVFLSVLVHELGHALSASLFGDRCQVLLYSMGGLTVSQRQPAPLHGWRHALVGLSGPAAGFLLALGTYLTVPWLGSTSTGVLGALYFHLVQVNVVWGLVNLLPVFPLDGGQVVRSLLSDVAGDLGHSLASGLSLLTAGTIAVAAWQMGRPLVALFAAYFAFKEWQSSL
jgi:stage IV sporulation protein FB